MRYLSQVHSLLGVLNKMGSIQENNQQGTGSRLLGVLNKMGSILMFCNRFYHIWFARCVKQDGFYT